MYIYHKYIWLSYIQRERGGAIMGEGGVNITASKLFSYIDHKYILLSYMMIGGQRTLLWYIYYIDIFCRHISVICYLLSYIYYISLLNRLPLIFFSLNVENVGECLCRPANSVIEKTVIYYYYCCCLFCLLPYFLLLKKRGLLFAWTFLLIRRAPL